MRDGEEARRRPLFNLRAVLAGAAVALAVSLAVAAVTALLVYFTPLSEQYLSLGLYYVGFLIVLAGGVAAARVARRLGWLHGGMAGLTAAVLALLATQLLFPGGVLPGEVTRQATLAFLTGAVGGIIGMNI